LIGRHVIDVRPEEGIGLGDIAGRRPAIVSASARIG
jgi:hypothetical protein